MDLLDETKKYVTDFFIKNGHEKFVYHNLTHTQKVVKRAKILCAESDLSEKEKEQLFIAAWFHDIGYLLTDENHEEKSAEIAKNFLLPNNFSMDDYAVVKEAILATKYPQKPVGKVAKYLCDADMYHLSLENFFEISLLLRKELKMLSNKRYSKLKYWQETLQLFEDHSYHTPYGKKVLAINKGVNKELLKNKINKLSHKKELEKKNTEQYLNSKIFSTECEPTEEFITERLKQFEYKASKFRQPVRGIETMFRVTGQNQISLSSIADNKANIMISANVIVISLVLSTIIDDLEKTPLLLYPVLLVLFTCLTTIVFSVLSTRPHVATGKFTKNDIKNKKVNLMFFGNFHNVKYDEYEWGVKELMKDYDYLYENLIKDQYSLGKVLAKKYKNLRTAYTVFMFGFIISVLSFALVLSLF